MFSQTSEDYQTAVEINRTVRGKATMSNESLLAPRGVWSMAVAIGMALITAGQAHCQTVIYDSTGFEPPTFTTGALGTFYVPPASGGQNGWLTTDITQQLNGPAGGAGQIVAVNPFAGTQSFRIDGTKLFNDTTFGGSTFWFRNAAAGAINPVGSGTPFVSVSTRLRVESTGITVGDMPLVGVYLEGYTAGGQQQSLTTVARNVNGGVTVVGPGATAGSVQFFNTADNIWATGSYHNLQATLNFNTTGTGAQTVSVTLDGNPLTFTPQGGGTATTTVPFRNLNGQTASIAEYGFQGVFNPNVTTTTNSAFFDNYLLTRAAVPEPASILLLCGGAAVAGWQFRRRKISA
jgi:hypothetical protein